MLNIPETSWYTGNSTSSFSIQQSQAHILAAAKNSDQIIL